MKAIDWCEFIENYFKYVNNLDKNEIWFEVYSDIENEDILYIKLHSTSYFYTQTVKRQLSVSQLNKLKSAVILYGLNKIGESMSKELWIKYLNSCRGIEEKSFVGYNKKPEEIIDMESLNE